MSAQRSKDTAPEIAVRRALHALGLRYRVHTQPVASLRRKADVVFPRAKVAVFIDGCFWHGCPTHGVRPSTNTEWWLWKLQRNQARDADTNRLLESTGWTVLRFWEHESPRDAADLVETTWRRLRSSAK